MPIIRTNKLVKILALLFGSGTLLLFIIPAITSAAFNQQINYQGKLTNASGVAVANGSYNMEFKLYTTSTGGVPIWTETLIGSDKVTVTNGLFSVMLGSTTPLSSVDFNQSLYLSVNIGGTGAPTWDGEMSPRKVLGTVTSAFEAGHLSGNASSTIIDVASSLNVLGSITLGGVTRFSWPSGTAGMLMGTTTLSYQGDLASTTGYKAADYICNAQFAGSHVCQIDEVLNTISDGSVASYAPGTAWLAGGPPGYVANANDCIGFTSNNSANLGRFWAFDNTTGGQGWLVNCSVSKPLACCK